MAPTPGKTASHRISLIEANDAERNRIIELLRQPSVVVDPTVEASFALDLIVDTQDDLLLTDFDLPDQHGAWLATSIRKPSGLNQHTPIIGISGDINEVGKKQGFNAGMQAIFSKRLVLEPLAAIGG